jgi:hypothetical protein
MKIYINNVTPINCNVDHTYKKSFIYTDIGIFCNKNKKLTQIDIINNNYNEIIKNGYTFIIDTSTEVYLDYITHIPYNHIFCEEKFEKTHIGHDIFYIKHYYFDQIEHYFEIEKLEDYCLKQTNTP